MLYSYKEMPKDQTMVEGMKTISGDTKQYRVRIKDLSYTKENETLQIKLLIPEKLDEKEIFPIYLHIQGSAWMKQDMNGHVVDLSYIASRGYIVAILGYRSTPDYLFPTQIKDVKSDIRYLYGLKDEFNIDFNRAYLGGDSSGGHTCLMCYGSWHTGEFDDEKTYLPEIKGFIDLYGPVNMTSMVEEVSGIDRSRGATYPEALLINGEVRDHYDEVQKTNPINYLNHQEESLLIMHGNKDRLVPFAQSVELYKACVDHQLNVQFYCVDNADHGGSAFYCEEALKVIIEFMK